MADEVQIAVDAGVATVTLNRPDQRNAMNTALLQGLRAAFDSLDERRDVRVVVVRGAGPAFCSGMDLKEMEQRRGEADPEGDVVEVEVMRSVVRNVVRERGETGKQKADSRKQ